MDIFAYSFMIRAFVAGGIIAATAPLIGNFLVVKRLSLIADALSHAALMGVAIGAVTGGQPLFVTVIVTSITALLIEQVQSRKITGDAVLAIFLPAGLAISLIVLRLTHGLNTNVFSYLFGSITTVQTGEIGVMIVLGIITAITVFILYQQLLYVSIDEESARVRGIPVRRINQLLILLTAVTVSLSLRIIGTLLIGALMVIPVITAQQIARSFKQSLYYSILFAELAVILGLFSSYYLSLPAGATIVVWSLVFFGFVSIIKR